MTEPTKSGKTREPDRKEAEMTAAIAEAPTAPKEESDEDLVHFGGRIPETLRRKAKAVAAMQGIDGQTILRRALEDYIERHKAF